ncbi:MAG TPA: glycine oxidase ThiO [Gammaproteobacteria bacterium]|nr:glycine oxidase ThiO [Gammaproteobacteria bacterium]
MANKHIDIAIVGGGLAGMLSAYYLADDGLKIAVFDKSRFAGESSWAGGGILSPLYPWRYADVINKLSFRSQQLYPALVSRLQHETGMDPEYSHCGMLVSAKDVDTQAYEWLDSNQVVYRHAVPEDYGQLSDDTEYLVFPEICQIRNPRFTASLKCALQQKSSVELYEHCSVNDIFFSSTGDCVVDTAQGKFTAAKVIVSAGAWSGKILGEFGYSLSIKPIRGQMLLYKTQPGLIPSIVLAEGKYIIPRKDGHVLVGSTMEDVGFNKNTTADALANLKGFVRAYCPVLAESPLIKHWAGLRPGSTDGIPFIYRHPKQPRLFVNTGHFRNGVVMAPASAELIRELVLALVPEQPSGVV